MHAADLVDGTVESIYATLTSLGYSLIGAEQVPIVAIVYSLVDHIFATTKPIDDCCHRDSVVSYEDLYQLPL